MLLPTSLTTLTINKFPDLERLSSKGFESLSSLKYLLLWRCRKLAYLPDGGFPDTLLELRIYGSPLLVKKCEKGKKAEYWPIISSIPCVCISGSISTCGLPSSLKRLHIYNCEKLETLVSLVDEMKILCPSLEIIDIYGCGRLKYLPDTHCGDSLGNLKHLTLHGCKDLQGLSDGWLHAITNLRNISIRNWTEGGETTAFSYILKEASFLTNLTHLRLEDMTTNVHPSKWDLNRLSSLTGLAIGGPIRDQEGEVVKVAVFPLDGMLLPTSLTTLIIFNFPDLERLSSKGFECLSSFEQLHIYNCPRLAYLHDGGFPDTLLSLVIYDCPLLEKKCVKGKGKYWPIISCIPDVYIGDKVLCGL